MSIARLEMMTTEHTGEVSTIHACLKGGVDGWMGANKVSSANSSLHHKGQTDTFDTCLRMLRVQPSGFCRQLWAQSVYSALQMRTTWGHCPQMCSSQNPVPLLVM